MNEHERFIYRFGFNTNAYTLRNECSRGVTLLVDLKGFYNSIHIFGTKRSIWCSFYVIFGTHEMCLWTQAIKVTEKNLNHKHLHKWGSLHTHTHTHTALHLCQYQESIDGLTAPPEPTWCGLITTRVYHRPTRGNKRLTAARRPADSAAFYTSCYTQKYMKVWRSRPQYSCDYSDSPNRWDASSQRLEMCSPMAPSSPHVSQLARGLFPAAFSLRAARVTHTQTLITGLL